MVNTNCRMYENQYPEVDDLVIVNVKQIAEMGAYVELLEYNNIEGMVLLSELSRRRIRSIQKLIRVNKQEVVVVMRVDKEKGYIDLSKRRVNQEEIAKVEDRYNKAKIVHAILRHCSEKLKVDLQSLYEKVGWPLYKKYVHAYDAFRIAITEPGLIFDGLDADQAIKDELISKIKHKLTPQPTKLRADVELTCFGYEGIDAIKVALLEGEKVNEEIKIRLVAPPLYVMVLNAIDKDQGIKIMEKCIDVINETLTKKNGSLIVKMKPKAVTQSDDMELQMLMSKVAKENAEVSGDDSEDNN